MTITQEQIAEMVKRLRTATKALREFYKPGAVELVQCYTMEDAADMLEQLAAERGKVAGVRVKPLEWLESEPDIAFAERAWSAETYTIEKRKHANNAFDLHCNLWDGDSAKRYETFCHAQAAAQADYEARIRAALEPAPDARTYADGVRDAAKAVLAMQGKFPMGTPQANAAHDVAIVRLSEIVLALLKEKDHD